MRRLVVLSILLSLAGIAFADGSPQSHAGPAAPYVIRHSALEGYPFKNGGHDQLRREDFGLHGNVRKMYIQTSDIIGEPGSLRDHVIVRFDSLGRVQTTITYPQSTAPNGFRYVYRPDGQLQRVERYNYQDGIFTGSLDQDNMFLPQGTDSEYFYDDQGRLDRIVFYDTQEAMLREYVYSYSANGYSFALNYAMESRRYRNQIFLYDNQGRLIASQKKDGDGKFVYTAKYSFNSQKNTETILQDYLNGAPTQKTVNRLDSGGRVMESAITDPQGVVMRKYTYSYDAEGRLSKELYTSPNDKITTVRSYKTDARGNLTEFRSSPDKGRQDFSLSVSYEYY